MLLEGFLASISVSHAVCGGRSQRRNCSRAEPGMGHQGGKCYRGHMGGRIRQQAEQVDDPVLRSGEEEEDEKNAGRQQGRVGKPH